MKKMKFFSASLMIAPLIILLIFQPATIIYSKDTQYSWELSNDSVVQKGTFTDDPQEVVFVYRKKKTTLPTQILMTKKITITVPPTNAQKSQYGELLQSVSGIFLFGSSQKIRQ